MKKLRFLLILGFCYLTGTSQAIRLQENFNAASLPAGWTNTAVSGTQTWNFGINGSATNAGNNNLDGTAMAFFDDDNLGASNTNNTVSLTSPVFDNSTDSTSTLEFDYNFREFAGPADRFYIEVYDGTTWNTVFSTTTNDCGNWLGACVGNFPHANIDISAHKNANCQVRFTYHDGNDWCWYVGIDNVLITSTVSNDLEISAIENPKSSCSLGTAEAAQILLKNLGGNNITSPFTVTLDVDNGSQTIMDTVNSTINVGDSLFYTFNSTIDLSSKGTYALTAYSYFMLDSNNGNDTLRTLVENKISRSIPFVEDFESPTSNWIISGQNSSWQIGTPNGTQLSSAFRGNGSAVTNLNGNYNNLETSYIETACIGSTQANSVPVLSFYLNYISEPGFDEMILESSVDNGTSWQKVNTGTLSSNWYTNVTSWSGSSNGWIRVDNTLDSLAGQSNFKLRFAFTSDGSGGREGYAIDNFELRYQDSVDIAINKIFPLAPSPQLCGMGTEMIKIQLSNMGQLNVDSTYVSYRINGGTTVTELLDSAVTSFQSIDFTFATPYNFSTDTFFSIDVWLSTRNDNYSGNDSIQNYVVNSGISIPFNTLPYFENFDGPAWFIASSNSTSIGSGWTINPNTWNVRSSRFRECIANGSLPAYDPSGNSSQNLTDRIFSGPPSVLNSPCIKLPYGQSLALEFYYFSINQAMNSLIVQVDDGFQLITLDTITPSSQSSCTSDWSRYEANLSSFSGKVIKIRLTLINQQVQENFQ